MQLKGELNFQGATRDLPVVAEQRGNAFQPLHHGVDVHMQDFLGAGQIAAALEVDCRNCRRDRRNVRKSFNSGLPAPRACSRGFGDILQKPSRTEL